MPQILQHDGRHRHTQGSGKILHCHRLLLFLVSKEIDEASRQILRISRLVELDGEFFAIRHLTEISQVRAHNGHAIGAGQMGHTTATRGGRVGHHGYRRPLEQVR